MHSYNNCTLWYRKLNNRKNTLFNNWMPWCNTLKKCDSRIVAVVMLWKLRNLWKICSPLKRHCNDSDNNNNNNRNC